MATGGKVMQLTIDKFGRILIPKVLRDDFNLTPGALLEIEEKTDQIVLKPVREKPAVIQKKGILVYTGKPVGRIEDTINQERENRLRKISVLEGEPGN